MSKITPAQARDAEIAARIGRPYSTAYESTSAPRLTLPEIIEQLENFILGLPLQAAPAAAAPSSETPPAPVSSSSTPPPAVVPGNVTPPPAPALNVTGLGRTALHFARNRATGPRPLSKILK